MTELRIYNSDANSPLSRCQSMSTWEERCVKYAEHVTKPDEQGADHVDERGYSWVSLNPTERGVVAHLDKIIAKDEALRQLLSYCRENGWSTPGPHMQTTMAEAEAAGGLDAYTDVATKLAAILDGES